MDRHQIYLSQHHAMYNLISNSERYGCLCGFVTIIPEVLASEF